MSWGPAARRISRRGAVQAAALAALAAACVPGGRQPQVAAAALERLAAAVRQDAYGRPVHLKPLLAGRVVLYFFRSDCPHCAAALAAAPSLATAAGAPALVLISREGAARLRAALGPAPRSGLLVLSDSDGAVMEAAVPTRFVPRLVAVAGSAVRRDETGADADLGRAVAELSAGAP